MAAIKIGNQLSLKITKLLNCDSLLAMGNYFFEDESGQLPKLNIHLVLKIDNDEIRINIILLAVQLIES